MSLLSGHGKPPQGGNKYTIPRHLLQAQRAGRKPKSSKEFRIFTDSPEGGGRVNTGVPSFGYTLEHVHLYESTLCEHTCMGTMGSGERDETGLTLGVIFNEGAQRPPGGPDIFPAFVGIQ